MTTATVGYPQQAGARFGSSLLVTDVDGEPPDDLVVGAPGTTVDGVKGAGAVYIIYGSPSGLGGGKPTLRLTEASLGVGRQASHFGAALAVQQRTWFEWQPTDPLRLAVGAPYATVDRAPRAGRLVLLDLPTLHVHSVVSQGHGSPGKAEKGDRFASTLASPSDPSEAYVAVGAPYEDVGRITDAGAVTIVGERGSRMFTQDSDGVPGKAEKGDHFGAAVTTIEGQPFGSEIHGGALVAAPEEDLGNARDAGGLIMLYLFERYEDPAASWRVYGHMITADSPGFSGVAESGDHLGTTLSGPLIGVPYEDIGTVTNAGAVCKIELRSITPGGRLPARCFNQDTPGVPGASEVRDHFGQTISPVSPGGDDPPFTIAVGAPGEDVGPTKDRGAVQIGEVPSDSPIESMRSLSGLDPQSGAAWGQTLPQPPI